MVPDSPNESAQLPAIPTVGKDALPHGLSYALTNSDFNRAFADSPASRVVDLWFSWRGAPKPNEELNTHAAIEISLSPGLESVLSRGRDTEDRFRVHVRAVPSGLRSTIRELLLSEGLPSIRQWAETTRPESWYLSREHQLRVSYDSDRSCLQFEESTR